MRVVMATSEVVPFAKTGGLGDVLGALPRALGRLGVHVAVVLPSYSFIPHDRFGIEPTGLRLEVPVSSWRTTAEVFSTQLGDDVRIYLIGSDPYFARPGIYGEGGVDYPDNAARFAFFSRAVLALLPQIGGAEILHAHDWQSALAPAFLRADTARYPELESVRSVFTIHNLGYQGRFWSEDWHLLNLDRRYFTPDFLEFYGDISFIKGGLAFADALTTVSPTYAREIQTLEYGHGLDGLLRARSAVLSGILNGVDYGEWDPAHDPYLAAGFSAAQLQGKATCKADLQQAMGLPIETGTPLLGIVSRLADQKGFDILAGALPALMQRPLQLVVLGSGEPRYETFLRSQAERFSGRLAVHVGFDEGLAHKIEAGSDLFLMPSRYEPCGLNQMYSLRYGTIPIVRATGGLQDSVTDPDDDGNATGFKFRGYDVGDLLAATDRALAAYATPRRWRRLMANAMHADFSWERSARAYLELYERLLV